MEEVDDIIREMRVFVLSPNIDTFFKERHHASLQGTGKEIVLVKEPKEMGEIPGLFDSPEEKILAIDPDFNNWVVENEDLKKIPNLKAIVLQTTSFSWIDVKFVREELGVPVVNLRGFSSLAVAEWSVMMAFNLARKIPVLLKDDWRQDYVKHQGTELKGKVVGVVGLGNIGTRIAEICQGIGMEVVYWSKNSSNEGFKKVGLEELMKISDVIFPAVAQNDETQGMITDTMIKSMKKTAIFVSIVHHVYNHELMLERVKSGDLYGYGFEVKNGEFGKYEGNVWAGPEMAWATDGSLQRNTDQWVSTIVKASEGNYENSVN